MVGSRDFINTPFNESFQASKLELGKNKSIISCYSGHQVIQFNYFPLVITFVANGKANTGECISV